MAQNSTTSIPTNSVVIINGQKYVLVPEKTFGKIEKMTDELPALRDENAALKLQAVNDAKIIAKDAELLIAKDKIIEADNKAFLSEKARADAEMNARMSIEKANGILQAENTKLRNDVKTANRRSVMAMIAVVATYLILR